MKASVYVVTQTHTRDPFQGNNFVDDLVRRTDNTKIKHNGVGNTPEIWINDTLAIKMRWLTETWELGPNLSRDCIDDKVPDLKTSKKSVTCWMKMNMMCSGQRKKICLRLSMSCNWCFTNLNYAFRIVVEKPSRTLHVYCNVAQSAIVGGMITDLSQDVWYERSGRGVVFFEPKHKQFHPVGQNTYKTVEVDAAGTNGALVAVPKATSHRTWITLHFIQD